MEIQKELFDFLALFIGLGAIGLYVLFSKQICDKRLSTQELKSQREIDKLISEKKELEFKYNSIKSLNEKLTHSDEAVITNFAMQRELKIKYEQDPIVTSLYKSLLKDYISKSSVILEDSTAKFEDKYAILNTLEKVREYIIFNSSLIKSLVIALVDSDRYLVQDKLVFLLKNIDKPVIVNNAIIDYYPWAVHDSIKHLIELLKETWDDINTNRLDDLIESLKRREPEILQPLIDFRNHIQRK